MTSFGGELLTKSWGDELYTDGAGSLPARRTSSYVTASLSPGQTENGVIDLSFSYRLVKLNLSAPCRLRMYGTVAERAADVGRGWGSNPGEGAGLMLDYLSVGPIIADLSPLVDGSSTTEPPTVHIPLSITATLATGPITAIFTWIRTE